MVELDWIELDEGRKVMSTDDFVAGNHTDKYGTKNPISKALMDGFLGSAKELFGKAAPQTVIELGCGEGELAARLLEGQQADYLGTDLSSNIIEEAQRRYPHLKFQARGADDIALPDGAFDLVVACEVLEHVEDPPAVLREIKRLSSKWALVSVPREPIWRALNMIRGAYWGELGNTPGHIQHWGRRQFIAFIESELSVVEVRTPLPWTMLLCRTDL